MAWGLWLLVTAIPGCGRGWKPLGGEGCSGEQGEIASAGSAAPCASATAAVLGQLVACGAPAWAQQ